MEFGMSLLTIDHGVMERRILPIGTLVVCCELVAVGPLLFARRCLRLALQMG